MEKKKIVSCQICDFDESYDFRASSQLYTVTRNVVLRASCNLDN